MEINDSKGVPSSSATKFGQYLRKAGITSFGTFAMLAPWHLSSSNVPGMGSHASRSLLPLSGALPRFCYREGITDRDSGGAVGMPQVYRLADVPRSITWTIARRPWRCTEGQSEVGETMRPCFFLVTYWAARPRGRQTHAGRHRLETRAIPGAGAQGWSCDRVSARRSSGRGPDRLSQTR